ncbi:DNA polymerase III [Arthrobacter sp. Hiyo4]|nr:DNA polymerase III [Arthrobacter sp. Hiyo4]
MTPAEIVLVGGPEEYLGIRAMDHVRAQVRTAFPDVEVSRLMAGTYEAGPSPCKSAPHSSVSAN